MSARLPGGIGALLTTDVERAELGEFAGRRLHARVGRRALRIAIGDARGFRLALTRLRPAAIEVVEGDRSYELPVAVPPDPWLRRIRHVAVLWFASGLLIGARTRALRAARRAS